MVKHLFKDRLYQDNEYDVVFSKRGKSDRTDALRQALETAQSHLFAQRHITSDVSLNITVKTPKEHAGLQAVDYFIWALQRLYERGEDRYLAYLWQVFGFVHDIDDTHKTDYGVYYTQNNPLTAETLKGRK